MGYRIGDAVRLRAGSDLCELLEPWSDAVGQVRTVDEDGDGQRIGVTFLEPSTAYTSPLSAEDF